MDFQKFVDGFHTMTCVMSVENLGDGKWGEIRIVCGNKAYVDSIENMPDVPQAFLKKFIPNSKYEDYFPKDSSFELFLYGRAVLKKPMHSYVHPDRFDFWFNLFSLPLDADDGKLCYCTYTQELAHEVDSEKMSNVSHDTAAEVLQTCIKLRGTSDFKTSMSEVIKDIRQLCGAAYCGILMIDELSSKCSLLCEDVSEEFKEYDPNWFSEDFYEIAKTWETVMDGSNCIIYKNPDEVIIDEETELANVDEVCPFCQSEDLSGLLLCFSCFSKNILNLIYRIFQVCFLSAQHDLCKPAQMLSLPMFFWMHYQLYGTRNAHLYHNYLL